MKSFRISLFLALIFLWSSSTTQAQRSLFEIGFPSSKHPYPDNEASPRVNPGIATGSSSGFYVRFGEDVAKLCASYGIPLTSSDPNKYRYPKFRVNVYATQGGFDSVKRLRYEREVQLAIVQSDLRYFSSKMINDEPDPRKKAAWKQITNEIKLVLPLYKEKVHILVRPEDKAKGTYTDLADLMKKGATVNVGQISSGGMITCLMLEDTITRSRAWQGNMTWKRRYHPTDAALDMLTGKNTTDRVDAVILVGGVPYPALKSYGMDWAVTKGLFKTGLAAKPQLALLPVGDVAKELLCPHDHEGGRRVGHVHNYIGCYVPDTINAGDYNFLGDNAQIETVGVYSCLVTHSSYTDDSRDSHKIEWVRHILFRILTKLDPNTDYGLPSDFGVPRAGNKWREVKPFPGMSSSETNWEDIYGWSRHDDKILRQMVDMWAAGGGGTGGSDSRSVVDPITLF